MQDHLLWCKKDLLEQEELFDPVEDEIREEMNNIIILSESKSGDQNLQIDFDDFQFEDSKSETREVNVNLMKPNSVRVKQEPLEPKSSNFETLENFDGKKENVQAPQAPIEDFEKENGPKIDTVYSHEQALIIHDNDENKVSEGTKGVELKGNQKENTVVNYVRPRLTKKRMKLFDCEWKNCGEKFKSRIDRMKHNQTHTGEKPYLCDWNNCNVKISGITHYISHVRTHTGEKPFACGWENCTKRFARKDDRTIHYRIHTGEKPYVCDWENCGKKFKTSYERTYHYRFHTGEKPYVCGWKNCTQRFGWRSNWIRHSKTHIA